MRPRPDPRRLRLACWLAALAALGACSTERTSTSLLSLSVLDDQCPDAEAARATLELLGDTPTRIDGMPCTLDEILEVSLDSEIPGKASCCYPLLCDAPLAPDAVATEFVTSCRGLPCSSLDLAQFSRARVADDVAQALPQCTVDPSIEAPIDQDARECRYRVTARYSCSTAPG